MNGPFPGMDPWLVSEWSDFHTRFLVYLAGAIAEELPDGLWAGVEQEVAVDRPGEDGWRKLRPDAHVSVAEPRAAYSVDEAPAEAEGAAEAAGPDRPLATPTRVFLDTGRPRRWVEITEADGGGVVTVIELLSPTNKTPGRGADAYRAKQDAVVDAGVNLLEIDLLREGSCVTLAPRQGAEPQAGRPTRCGFHLSLANARAGGTVELYAFGLTDPLPKIALPLRDADEPIALDLQEVLALTQRRGRYARRFDYAEGPPGPPLGEEDRAWVDARVAAWRAAAAKAA